MTGWTERLLFFPLKDRSKEPATPHGHLDAKPIADWPVELTSRNWGIRCGPESGITVIDVDPRNGGDIQRILPLLPGAPRVKTGGGGWHFYCKNVPAGTKFVKIPGIDFKNNGYVVAPGSIHPSGTVYEWEQDLGDLPEFPAEFILSSPSTSLSFSAQPVDLVEVTSALAALDADDYEVWVKVGMALHATGHPDARKIWDAWSKKSPKFNARESEKKWNSFKGDGQVTIGTLFHLAREAGWSRLDSVEGRPYRVASSSEIVEAEEMAFSPSIPVPILEELRRWIAPVCDPVSAIAGALTLASLKFARTARTTKGDLPVLYFGLVGPTATNAIPVARAVEKIIRDSHVTWMLRGGSLSSEEKLKRALLHSSVLFYFSHAWASTITFSYKQPSGAMAQALRTLELAWHGAHLQHDPEKKNEEPQWIFSPHVALIAGIGESEFPTLLSADELARGTHETMLFVPAQKRSEAELSDPSLSALSEFLSSGDPVADAQPPVSTVDPVKRLLPIDDSGFEDPSSNPAFFGYRRIARRIALLLALSANYRAPDVPAPILEWSFRFVTWCAAKTEKVETGRDGKPSVYDKILLFLRKRGTKGATRRELVQYVWDFKNLKEENRGEILVRMADDGAIERIVPPGKRTETLFAAEFTRKVSS